MGNGKTGSLTDLQEVSQQLGRPGCQLQARPGLVHPRHALAARVGMQGARDAFWLPELPMPHMGCCCEPAADTPSQQLAAAWALTGTESLQQTHPCSRGRRTSRTPTVSLHRGKLSTSM